MHRILTRRFIIFLFVIFSVPNGFTQDKSHNRFDDIIPYAELSNAIYEDKPTFKNIAVKWGYQISELKNISGLNLYYALLNHKNNRKHLVIIRGTANVENAMTDLDINLVFDKKTENYFHKGFLQASSSIYKHIKHKLKPNYQIDTSGHSLGGAVAVVLAMQLSEAGVSIDNIVTFGQPKVTNFTSALEYSRLKLTRFVTPLDLVPVIPPIDIMDMKNINVYWHVGTEIILINDHQHAELTGLKSMLRGLDFVNTIPDIRNIESHNMAVYLALIKQNNIRSTKTIYNIAFNPLKFFN